MERQLEPEERETVADASIWSLGVLAFCTGQSDTRRGKKMDKKIRDDGVVQTAGKATTELREGSQN